MEPFTLATPSRLAGSLLAAAACAAAQAQQVVQIGLTSPLSGPQSAYGWDNRDGMPLAPSGSSTPGPSWWADSASLSKSWPRTAGCCACRRASCWTSRRRAGLSPPATVRPLQARAADLCRHFYDGAMLLADAMQKAGSTEPGPVGAQIAQGSWRGVAWPPSISSPNGTT